MGSELWDKWNSPHGGSNVIPSRWLQGMTLHKASFLCWAARHLWCFRHIVYLIKRNRFSGKNWMSATAERRKRSRWPISDGLPSLDESLFQSRVDQLPMNSGLGGGISTGLWHRFSSSIFPDAARYQFHHWPLQKLGSPYDQACELFHCYLHLNVSPQFQATFCSPTLSSLITDKEVFPGFVKELQRHGTDM